MTQKIEYEFVRIFLHDSVKKLNQVKTNSFSKGISSSTYPIV